MATVLETRKTSKSEAYLQRKFAELCARIKRIDLIAHLLMLSLTVLSYALVAGLFDLVVASKAAWVEAARWVAFGAFVIVFGFLLVQTMRCAWRRVNPYFVAHQLEQTLPEARNSLINWLDLQDEEIPSAFHRNLSARAAEQLQESDFEQAAPQRKNWGLLGALTVPILGLFILLLLGPASLWASLLHAFAPFYTPAASARTQITLVQPDGDAEVGPGQALSFVVRIDGRPGTPKLYYRYPSDDDFLTQPLQPDDAGHWTTTLHPSQVRGGFTYKVSAGGEETPEHQVRTRPRAHVAKFEIAYHHPAYRKLPKAPPTVFPNEHAARPMIHGPAGSEVEVIVHPSRPVRQASIQIISLRKWVLRTGRTEEYQTSSEIDSEMPLQKRSDGTWSYKLKLDGQSRFRVLFTATDGEDNTDRDWRPIDVRPDDAPLVVLTQPGKDVVLPANGTLELEGRATSGVGVKSLTLHFRVLDLPVKLAPRVYRPGVPLDEHGQYVEPTKSLESDGTFPGEIEYQDVIPLTKWKNERGANQELPAGTVIEYWLEAVDCTDTPLLGGQIGKSSVYKITLTSPQPAAKVQSLRQKAMNRQNQFAQQQRDKAQQDKAKSQKPNGGAESPQEKLDANQKDKQAAENKIKQAWQDQANQQQQGSAKSGEPDAAQAKDGAPEPKDGPQQKGDSSMSPDAGKSKGQGDGNNDKSQAKDAGAKKDGASKGERKDGPKESPSNAKSDGPTTQDSAGGAKSGDAMNMPPLQAKESGDGPPTPIAKGEPQPQSNVKGVEQNGPDLPNKDAAKNGPPPDAMAKAGKMDDSGQGAAKKGPPTQEHQPGDVRGNDAKVKPSEPTWDNIAKWLDQLKDRTPQADDAGRELAKIAGQKDDPRKSDLAKDILTKNGRDPKTGRELKKGPSPIGAAGKSPGLVEDVKLAAANREFAARIGQLQLDDWKKRVTPQMLKKAGMTETDWQRYLKNMQAHDALVRDLNAKLLKDALTKELRGAANPSAGGRTIESTGTGGDLSDAGRGAVPPEFRDALRRLHEQKKNPQ